MLFRSFLADSVPSSSHPTAAALLRKQGFRPLALLRQAIPQQIVRMTRTRIQLQRLLQGNQRCLMVCQAHQRLSQQIEQMGQRMRIGRRRIEQCPGPLQKLSPSALLFQQVQVVLPLSTGHLAWPPNSPKFAAKPDTGRTTR